LFIFHLYHLKMSLLLIWLSGHQKSGHTDKSARTACSPTGCRLYVHCSKQDGRNSTIFQLPYELKVTYRYVWNATRADQWNFSGADSWTLLLSTETSLSDCNCILSDGMERNNESQWPRGLSRRSTTARMLRSWIRIPPGGMDVCHCVCCQVEVSATSWSLVQGSPTDCGASLCVIKKPRERGGHIPRWAAEPEMMMIMMAMMMVMMMIIIIMERNKICKSPSPLRLGLLSALIA
jgi:hypothetical protein